MPRTVLSRLTALAFALLVSLTASGTALAHAIEHAHVAQEHHDDHGPSMMPEFEAGEHGHAHGHASVDTPTSPRNTQLTNVMIAAMCLVAIDLTPPTADAPRAERLPAQLPRHGGVARRRPRRA